MDLNNSRHIKSFAHLYVLLLSLIIAFLACPYANGTVEKAEMSVLFHLGKCDIDSCLGKNARSLYNIRHFINEAANDSNIIVTDIEIYGHASPEGPLRLNKILAHKRMQAIESLITLNGNPFAPDKIYRHADILDLSVLIHAINRSEIKERQIAIDILSDSTIAHDPENRLKRLKNAQNGRIWNHIKPLLCNLRYSKIVFTYNRDTADVYSEIDTIVSDNITETDTITEKNDTITSAPEITDETHIITAPSYKPLYLSLKTNILYDAILIPNIGIEFYLGKMMSINANWSYAWWSRNRSHNYWRYYGGDIAMRRWFGRKATDKPLTGHHIGLYAQILTYDFELGGKGYMGNKYNYGGGIEYGFSLPAAPRINIDFTLGVGYIGGRYYEYIPLDGHYVWQSTKQRHWFGPTKAEISLVWLIGPGNYNRKKGGVN